MKKLSYLFVTCLSFATTANALDLSVFKSSYEYHEPNLMQITGNLVGLEAVQKHKIASNTYLNFNAKYSVSDVNYLALVGGAEVNGVTDKILDVSASIERDYQFNRVTLTPSVGVAKYKVSNLLHSTGVANELSEGRYDRFQTYNYNPISLKMNYSYSNNHSFFAKYTYKNLSSGNIISKLSQVNSTIFPFDISCTQSQGMGETTLLGFNAGNYSLSVFSDSWRIEDSDLCLPFTGFKEPKNTTTQTGLKLTISF